MPDLNDTFLDYFGAIENKLNTLISQSSGPPPSFYRKVELAQRKNPTVRHFQDELKTFGDLRNFLSHNNQDNYATPSNTSVKRIETIYKRIVQPATAYDKAGKDVRIVQETDSLRNVLDLILKTGFTHFPVYRGQEFKGLLTENGLTIWMAQNDQDGEVKTGSIQIKNVLPREEKVQKENVLFVSRNKAMDEVVEQFTEPHLRAVLVTENGKSSEKILGIITPWDVLDYQMEN